MPETTDTMAVKPLKSTLNLPKPPADLAAMFHAATAKAISSAEGARRRNPNDISALHDLGTAYGLQASWIASVEGSVLGAFGIARRAYDACDEALSKAQAEWWFSDFTVSQCGRRCGAYLSRAPGHFLPQGLDVVPEAPPRGALALGQPVERRLVAHGGEVSVLLPVRQPLPHGRLLLRVSLRPPGVDGEVGAQPGQGLAAQLRRPNSESLAKTQWCAPSQLPASGGTICAAEDRFGLVQKLLGVFMQCAIFPGEFVGRIFHQFPTALVKILALF